MANDESTAPLQAAIRLIEQDRPAEALAILRPIMAAHAENMVAQNTIGRALLGLGQTADALTAFTRAHNLAPGDPGPGINIGLCLDHLDRPAEALAHYEAICARWPRICAGHRLRATALARLGRPAEALALLQQILAEWPQDLETMVDRGNLQMRLDQFTAALSSYTQAAAMAPQDATVRYNRGTALQALDRHADAVQAFDEALQRAPGQIITLINRANSLRRLTRHPEAIADYEQVLRVAPDNAMALANLGKALGEIGQHQPALAYLERAVQANPNQPEIRWMLACTTIPSIRQVDDDLAALRAGFATALTAYDAWSASVGDVPAMINVGRPHPFFLAYQEANNRDLMAQYGAHCARVMARWREAVALPAPRAPRQPGAKLRVGIVSAHVNTHSVWLAIMRGWLMQADPARIGYHVFYLGAGEDPQTGLAARLAERFESGVRGFPEWARLIQDADLDVLVYPEIGMDDLTVKLASLRLAPVQVAAWGHPETTGLPSIDAYVSAAAFEPGGEPGGEPEGAQAHYTERLVTLPRLGCCYTPLPVRAEPPDLAAFGLDPDRPIAICPGAPFKYVPEYDHAYVEIARLVPNCQLVFFRQNVNPLLSDAVFARMRAAFAAAGLDFAHVARPIPWQTLPQFYGLMQRADVFLDTLGFSGFNTAIQAIECGLPVVTMEGKFMRGRLASGILRQMDMAETVAMDTGGYADIAARLLTDAPARAAARLKLIARRERLFDDVGTVRAFEDFLHDACRAAATGAMAAPGTTP